MSKDKKTLASKLIHRITVQADSPTLDDDKGEIHNWSNIASYYASVKPMNADLRNKYRSIEVDATHVIEVRGESAITEQNRIIFKDRVFVDLAIRDIEERGELKMITCKEVRR